MVIAAMGSRLIGMVALVFLARLLEPEDFGIVALAMVLFSTTRLFSDLGMAAALIHSQRDKGQIAFQAFVVTVATSLALFALVNANPSFFATLLGNPTVEPVLRWLSLLILLDAWVLVPAALLRKELSFGKVSRALLIANGLGNIVAIALAFLGYGIWSLVWGRLANSLVELLITWFACPGWDWLIPKRWEWGLMRELLGYGAKSTGGGFMNFFNSNWDDWLVGRMLGATALGFYDKAYSLTNGTIAGINTSVISAVLFPSYTKIQGQKEHLSQAYIKGLGISALVMAPLAMGLLAIANEVVPLVFGEKWMPMIPTLQIFAFMGLIRPMAGSTSPLFRAIGRPDFDLRAGLLVTVIMVPMALLLLDRGIEGVAFAVTVSYLCGFLYNIFQVHQVLPDTASKMVPAILPAIVASCAMIVGVYLAKQPLRELTSGQPEVIFVSALVVVGGIIYLGIAFLIRRTLILELLHLFATIIVPRFAAKRASP